MAQPVIDKNASSAIDENDFDDEHGEHHPHRNSVHHRLRASSSIMQLKKLLGTLLPALNGPLEAPQAG
jgi:pyruvate carboxylase